MNFPAIAILFGVFIIWLGVLTFFFLRFYLFYMKIKKGTKQESLIPILNDVVTKEQEIGKAVVSLTKKVDELDGQSQFYIQKIGMTRFNPFNDTGGDQSFILSLLDATDTGVVISSLHTRTGTRWYAKKIERGQGSEHKLSEEEKEAISVARKLSKGI